MSEAGVSTPEEGSSLMVRLCDRLSMLPTRMAVYPVCGCYLSDYSNHPEAAQGYGVSVSYLPVVFGGPERGG